MSRDYEAGIYRLETNVKINKMKLRNLWDTMNWLRKEIGAVKKDITSDERSIEIMKGN